MTRDQHHHIRWDFDRGGVIATATCAAPDDADCRLQPTTCECEAWGAIQRRDDGTIWHKIVDYGDSHEPLWHQVIVGDECNICTWLNEGELMESGDATFTIESTPICPVWQGDGYTWEPIGGDA